MPKRRLHALAVVLAMPFSFTSGAQAAEMTWRFQNNHPNAVDIQLFGVTRNWRWPSTSTVWTHNGSGVREYSITCRAGEYICFGAGVRNVYSTYWGRGMYSRSARCADCCNTCTDGSQTVIYQLNP